MKIPNLLGAIAQAIPEWQQSKTASTHNRLSFTVTPIPLGESERKAFTKGEIGTTVRFKQTPPVDIAISAITAMELRYGLALNPQRAQKVEPAIASILSSVTILPFGTVAAEQTAQIRAVPKSQGQPIGAYDVLIAATALQHSLMMVIANQREFARIPDLQTENWRQS